MASDTEVENTLSQAAHHRLGYEEVERIVCFRKDLVSQDADTP
jgi:aminoglycoside 6'-N-acetyltransferase I